MDRVLGGGRRWLGGSTGWIDPAATPTSTVELSTSDGCGVALLASVALVAFVAMAFEFGDREDRPLARSAIVEAASTGFLVADPDGTLVDANSRARRLLAERGREVDEGAAVADVFPTLPALASTDGDGWVVDVGDEPLRVDVDRLPDDGPGEWLLSLRPPAGAAASRAGTEGELPPARGIAGERESEPEWTDESDGSRRRSEGSGPDDRRVDPRYGPLLEFLDDAVFAIDGDDRIVFVDETFAETFGGTPAALADKHLSVAFRDDAWGRLRAAIERTRSGERADEDSVELRRRDTEGTRTLHVRVRSVETVPGVDVLGTVGDVTDRRDREREHARYERIVTAIGEPIYVADGDGTVTFVNEAAAALTGYSASMLEGSDVSVVLSAEDRKRIDDALAEIAAAGRDCDTVDVSVITRSGDRVLVENEVTPLPGDDAARGHAGVLRDVSERKRREATLQRYETMVEALGDPLYAIDPDGTISFANGAFETMLGYPVEDALAGDLELVDVVPSEDVDRVRSVVQDLLSDEETGRVTLETRLVTADGRRVPVETNIASLPDDGEANFGGTANVARDIADRKRRREVMAVTNRALRHNLRTHLQLIEGYADILGEAVEDGDVGEYVEGIHTSSDWLSKLGDTLRDLQETIEQNRGPPDPTDVDFLADLAATYRNRHPSVSIETDVSDSFLVEAGDVVEDAVEHLLENAIVHNDAADPAVCLEVSAEPRDGWVEIAVADNGPGIPEQERRIIMGDADITQLQHGSGIGLWATRWLIQTVDGEIDIEDREPRGTVVRIRLPTVEGPA